MVRALVQVISCWFYEFEPNVIFNIEQAWIKAWPNDTGLWGEIIFFLFVCENWQETTAIAWKSRWSPTMSMKVMRRESIADFPKVEISTLDDEINESFSLRSSGEKNNQTIYIKIKLPGRRHSVKRGSIAELESLELTKKFKGSQVERLM